MWVLERVILALYAFGRSVAFPAFVLGHNPSAQIICASYGQDLANKHSSDCRTLMTSGRYRSLFPTRLAPQKQSVQEFVTTQNGFRLATSIGGVLTGRGADFVIIDDPLKPDEALSETQRKAVNEWYDHTLYSRLNDKQTGCIIIIMQRLHEDDLVGHVLEQEAWDLVRLSACFNTATICSTENRFRFIRKILLRRILAKTNPQTVLTFGEPLSVTRQFRTEWNNWFMYTFKGHESAKSSCPNTSTRG